jgi:hypothetical protein
MICFERQAFFELIDIIAIAAEVAEPDMFELAGVKGFEDFESGVVREMSVAAFDALFEGPRTLGVLVEEFAVVIGFEYKVVEVLEALEDALGHVA